MQSGDCPIFWSVGRRLLGEAVLHREQGRFGARRDAELAVDVLEVRRDRLAGDREIFRDLGIRPAPREGDEDVGLAAGESAGEFRASANALAAGTEDRIHHFAVEAAGARFVAQIFRLSIRKVLILGRRYRFLRRSRSASKA